MNKEMNNNINNDSYFITLPEQGWNHDKVLDVASEYCKYGNYSNLFFLYNFDNDRW